jgi:hypothetical protein
VQVAQCSCYGLSSLPELSGLLIDHIDPLTRIHAGSTHVRAHVCSEASNGDVAGVYLAALPKAALLAGRGHVASTEGGGVCWQQLDWVGDEHSRQGLRLIS